MATHIGAEPVQHVVSEPSTYQRQAGPAIPVYVYTSLPAGVKQVGGKALAVYFIKSSDLVQNGGQYKLSGRRTALPVIVVSANQTNGPVGGAAIPVYDVTSLNW